MRTLSFNGEFWYEDRTPLLKRIARWCIWFGGWETHRNGGWPLLKRLRQEMISPVSLFGHRLTYFGHWADMKLPGHGILVVNWRERYAFISRDGTPDSAHTWLYGWPRHVERMAMRRMSVDSAEVPSA